MLIDCEKCSTRYVLDDALIPAQGAAVQCTRCGHVFTARVQAPPQPVAPRAPGGNSTMMFGSAATSEGAPAPSAKQTMVFGAGGAPPPPAAAANKNQTMMFGTPASNAAAVPPPQSAPLSKQTMVFGAGAVPPPPAAPNKNQPMMFGTPASNAAAAAPPQSAPASKQTMVFGAGAVPPPPAAAPPNKNQTMVFGTPASNAPAPPPPAAHAGQSARTTIMFGGGVQAPPAAPAQQSAPSSKTTMMFGGVQAPPPTQPPPHAAGQPSAKTTMMFGGVQAPPAAPAPSPNKTTMMFGSVGAPPPAAPARPTFGTPEANAALDSPSDETVLESPGQSARTLMFGAPTGAPAPSSKQTMMFGRSPNIPKVTAGSVELAGMSADEGAPNESTVRVDHPLEEAGAAPGAEGDGEGEEALPRRDRTQRFAMSDLGGTTPPDGQSPAQERHNRTQLFAMSTAQEPTAPMVESMSATLTGDVRARDVHTAPTIDLATTLPPDQPLPDLVEPSGVSVLHDPANYTPMDAEAAPLDGPVATTLSNLAPISSGRSALPPLRLELPQEPGGSPEDLVRAPPVSSKSAAQEDAAALRAARGGGAGRVVVIILALVALALLGVLIYRLFGDQLLALINPPPQPVGALLQPRPWA